MSTAIGTRERKKTATRQRIIAVTFRLLRQHGLAGVTIRAITREVGIAVGTFFNYFPSKEAVLSDIGQERIAAIRELIAGPEYAGATTRERVVATFHLMALTVEDEPELSRAVAAAILRSPETISVERRHFFVTEAFLAALLREGQVRGEVAATADCATAASLLTAAYVLLVLDWVQGDRAGSLAAAMLAHVAFLWPALAPTRSATDSSL